MRLTPTLLLLLRGLAACGTSPPPAASHQHRVTTTVTVTANELPLLCTIQRGMARGMVVVRYRWDGTVTLGG
jgi:hypothetical protein